MADASSIKLVVSTLLEKDWTDLHEDVAVIKATLDRIEKQLVTRAEFRPVRAVAYGLVALMAAASVAAVASAVIP